MKSQSTLSLSQSLYGSLPRSLKQDLMVKSRVEDPEVLAERRAIVASKSVSELSQITSISDFPVPKTLSRAFHKSMEMLTSSRSAQQVEDEDSRSVRDNLTFMLTSFFPQTSLPWSQIYPGEPVRHSAQVSQE